MEFEPLSEGETQPVKKDNRNALIAWAIIVGLFLVTIIAGSFILFARLRTSPKISSPTLPAVYLPTTDPATPTPITKKLIRLPVVLSGDVPVWKVTKVKSLGYKLGSKRYDLATFVRSDNQTTAQGYCINPGWDVPKAGAEYLLTAGDIFVPMHEPKPNTIQRFQKIK